MEIYALDALRRRVTVVDRFISLIWTERWQTFGDFELVLNSTTTNRAIFTTGTMLAMNSSHRIMVVEIVKKTTDADGRTLLKVTGRSLEKILEDRVARDNLSDLTTEPKWAMTGTAGNIMRQIFHDICVTGNLSSLDLIPNVVEDNLLFPDDTIPESSDVLSIELEPTTVYEALNQLGVLYDLGFRLVRNLDTSQVLFDVYAGCDRTTSQTDFPAVVFSQEMGNLQNTTEVTTISDAKNVAYVVSPVGHEVVYPAVIPPDIAGFDRRVLLVKADDITTPVPELATILMIQRGLEELSRHRSLAAFDGEVSQASAYIYGVDYNLGDLVELRNEDGNTSTMRVTEQIFASDAEGERSYPSLSISAFINPGTWLAWDYNVVWEDMGLTEYWDTMP